ncbi:cystatin [Anolis carolinensis]|uniref:Cystatin domain-containing protein n=1 Tax=Anolis carolinensis TaxID=28377 RepID=R4GCH1_ANOCA|nr:PREDICTED: cystatin [Anolis carolinensis]|eukprot:XP_008119841.1 PREDICTED: cystatin [Anolis carolinensis]
MAQVSFLAGVLCSLSFLLLVVPPVVPDDDTAAEVPRVELPISDPKVQDAVALAVKSFNTQSSSDYYYKQLEVLSAESQAVEGIKYFLTIVLAQTNCKKRKAYDLKEAEFKKCEVSEEAEKQKHTCEFEVWMNEKKTSAGIQTWKRLSWRCTWNIPYSDSQ